MKRPVPLTSMDELVLDGNDALEQIWNHDFSAAWEEYLRGFEGIGIKSIHDIIGFNKRNAEKELPPRYSGQQLLEESIGSTKIISDEKYEEGIKLIRNAAGVGGIDKTMTEYDLDVILGPMDGRIPTIAATAGYPVGTMPLGYSKTNGRRFGVCIIAGAGQEHKILRAMRAWEGSIRKRKPPPQMSNKHLMSTRVDSYVGLVDNKQHPRADGVQEPRFL